MVIDEGYIKYQSSRVDGDIPSINGFDELNTTRTDLFDIKLIGIYDNGIGYGNISLRSHEDQFIISGSATGGDRVLKSDQYALVKSFDLKKNRVEALGRLDASSESMSHGAVYEALSEVNCVIHVHSRDVFDYMLEHGRPKTSKDIAFGTPQLANAIKSLVLADGGSVGVFVTAGHDEGVIAYGNSITSAKKEIQKIYNKTLEWKNG